MNALFLVFLGLVGFASAQYECSPGFCSQTNGLSRANVFGCQYFCYYDMSQDLLIQHVEADDRYDEWRGTGVDCDRNCFVTVHRSILIGACDTELNSAFDIMGNIDSVPATVSHLDIDLWYDELVAAQGAEPVAASGFQTWFLNFYSRINDQNCTLTYP